MANSTLTLNGTNLFLNNTSSRYSEEIELVRKKSLCNYHHVENANSGGAISCSNSHLRFYGHANFTDNMAESFGGVILVESGDLIIKGNAVFNKTVAKSGGGAIFLNYASSNISGKFSLSTNTVAEYNLWWSNAYSIRKCHHSGICFI